MSFEHFAYVDSTETDGIDFVGGQRNVSFRFRNVYGERKFYLLSPYNLEIKAMMRPPSYRNEAIASNE